MTAAAAMKRVSQPSVFGSARPRLAPPLPARSSWRELHEQAAEIRIDLFPWQDRAGRYLYALAGNASWLYPEVAVIVSRQNGKTEILVPHIVKRLRMGRRIMHTAQNRELPREVFGRVADVFEEFYPGELARSPRFANGQEEIKLVNGGRYRIVAPTRGGARGPSNDDLIVDEVRELDSHDFIAAAKPTMNASPNPQALYLSNMGDDSSEVLNAILLRAGEDPALACLEWSAAPERDAGDVKGWLEANPSAGHLPQILGNLQREYRSHRLAGTLAIFETEHLCRPVMTMRDKLVEGSRWASSEEPELEPTPTRAFMGVAMDPHGQRASAAVAWPRPDGTFGLRLMFDVTGSPIDSDHLGKDIRDAARRAVVLRVGFDPQTDAMLAKYFTRTEPIAAQKHANASARFVELVEAGKVRWEDAYAVGADLERTTKRDHDASGSFQAVRADDQPITALLAALRALWLASAPRPTPTKRTPSTVSW